MDTRIKMIEIKNFYKNLKIDYKSGNGPSKSEKRKWYLRLFKLLFMNVWNGITSPFIYPIWYAFRKSITNKLYSDITWEEVTKLVDDNKTRFIKEKLKKNGGNFLYWMWTYGDLRDPLGRGELMEGKKNTFWNRYWETGFRNCRFTTNFMEFRTGNIVRVFLVTDNRNFAYMHRSEGIGDSPDGIYFKWMLDDNDRWGFIYEDNNDKNLFYLGNVGLLKSDIGNNGRFETGYRKTSSSYNIKGEHNISK